MSGKLRKCYLKENVSGKIEIDMIFFNFSF